MTGWLDTLATTAHRTGFSWRAGRASTALRRTDDPIRLTLADALDATLADETDTATLDWIRKIEALREVLSGDTTALSFHDYGLPHRLAGGADARLVTRTVQDVCRASTPPHEGRLLYHLVQHLRPAMCLELGTCLGISAAYQAAALATNGAGRLVTLEGGAALAERARGHLARLGLSNAEVVVGRFQDTLPDVLAARAPIDFVFLDGHHDSEATRGYVRHLRPHLAADALLLVDDIAWSPGMRRAWRAITSHAAVDVDLLTVGLCFY